jgi:HK97 family phage prohead protease
VFETRTIKADYTVDSKDGLPKFVGMAAVYNAPSQVLFDKRIGAFKEVIKPGAFTRSLNSSTEIKADVNHEPTQVIGRRSKGTLILTDNKQGLKAEITPPDTSYARDAIEAVKSGNYDGMSFEFAVNKGGDRFYRNDQGELIRELLDVELKRVSVVAEPAYTQTQVELRNIDEAMKLVEVEVNSKSYYEYLVKVSSQIL